MTQMISSTYNEYCFLSTKLSLHKINYSKAVVMRLSRLCQSALLVSWNFKWIPKNMASVLSKGPDNTIKDNLNPITMQVEQDWQDS